MSANTLLCLALMVPVGGDAPEPERKRNPWAPSLPLLTREEEAEQDQIIDRFMLADIGQLRGAEALEAKRDFVKLGPEATFALIRGLNRAAKIEHTCPALVISKKLMSILNRSEDRELLEFAKDNIGIGVGQTRHAAALQNLRYMCRLRMNALARRPRNPVPTSQGTVSPRISTASLIDSASTARGARLRTVVLALAHRKGDEVLGALATACLNSDPTIERTCRQALDYHLRQSGEANVVKKLNHDHLEVRKGAIRVIAAYFPSSVAKVIDLLTDTSVDIREETRTALVKLNRGRDLGPGPFPNDESWRQARNDWSDWWQRARR